MSRAGSIRPSEPPVPGAGPLLSRRPQTLARHLGFAFIQTVGCSGGGQFAITSSVPLSALRPKSCLAEAAVRQNPHKRQTTRRFPRVRSSEAFRRRPLHWPINRVRPASETLHVSGPRCDSGRASGFEPEWTFVSCQRVVAVSRFSRRGRSPAPSASWMSLQWFERATSVRFRNPEL